MDIGGLIASFATGSYTVTRRAKATLVNGRRVAGAMAVIPDVVACVQPASGRDLLRLPEGRRSIETCVVFTATELLVGGEGKDNDADLIEIGGEQWECQQVQQWTDPDGGAVGYRCIVQVAAG